MPKSAKHALNIDKKNGNAYWSDAIAKDMKNMQVAFQILDDNKPVTIGYKFICCHIIFHLKMEDFCRQACLVARIHVTETPATMTYASVVSRESVRLALMLAALNALEVKCGDVENFYISDQITYKV